jgi:RND family efflux transporter MFP subunit
MHHLSPLLHVRFAPVLCAALALVACRSDNTASLPQPPSVALPVAVATVAPSGAGEMASGAVMAEERVELASRTSGTVRSMGLHEGQSVRQGQVLAQIDSRQADSAVRRARAALEAALAEQSKADGDITLHEPLVASGAMARNTFLNEQLRSRVAATAVEEARAALAGAEADRSYNSVTSPLDGIVVSRQIRDGDIAMPGTPLVTIEGQRNLVFRFAVPQSSLAAFEPGTAVPVMMDGREDQPIAGRVRGIVPSADPATRRYTVELALPPDSKVLAGMFGRVHLPSSVGESSNLLTVPASAVTDRGGLNGVFVVGNDERVEFRWLRLGERRGDEVVVTSGLSAGERILARVDSSVRDGARLTRTASR